MSEPIDSITERIHRRVDKELTAEIAAAMQAIERFLQNDHRNTIQIESSLRTQFEAYRVSVYESLKERAFSIHRDGRRSKAVTEFMGKVESLESQLQEIRDQIPS